MSHDPSEKESLHQSLSRQRPYQLIEVIALFGVLFCALAGGWLVNELLQPPEPPRRIDLNAPFVDQQRDPMPVFRKTALVWIGLGAFLGLSFGVLLFWAVFRLPSCLRSSSQYSGNHELSPLEIAQRDARARQRQMEAEQWNQSIRTQTHSSADDDDNELIPSNRNQPDVKYTAEDFPCPPSMPGRKSSVGSMFCDFYPKKGEVAFAVVQPDYKATAEELRAIGNRLQEWKISNGEVRRILGLEQLLGGSLPEVRRDMFCLDAVTSKLHIALIYVTEQADNEATGKELIKTMNGLRVEVCSPDYFSKLRE